MTSGFGATSVNIQDPVEDNVTTPGATRNATDYKLALEVGTNTPGLRLERIYYDADGHVTTENHSETIRAQRLCDAAAFNVNQDGSISGLTSVPVEPEVSSTVQFVPYPDQPYPKPHGM